MRIGKCAAALCAAACVQIGVASAQTRTLTLAEVLALARDRAPRIVSARLTVDEARSGLLGASRRFESNPEVEGGLGHRSGPDRHFTDFEIGIGQRFELPSRREARVASANAAVAQSTAGVEDVTREVLWRAASAYFRVLHAQERIRLLDATREVAAGVRRAADRRYRSGDVAVLDVNIATASLARVSAERESAAAARALAVGDLARILGLDREIRVDGSLLPGGEADLETLLQAASQRPGIRALEAAVQEAEAEARLGRAFSKPDFGIGVRYAQEEGDKIVAGGLTITLPVFSKGQERKAVGEARATRLRAELDAARILVRLEVRSAFEAYTRRMAALRLLEADALPGMEENDALTTRSFEVGQIGLPELLLIRREILETRAQHLDALLEAALARIDLDASAGVLR